MYKYAIVKNKPKPWFSLIFINFHKFSRIFMDFHGFSWISWGAGRRHTGRDTVAGCRWMGSICLGALLVGSGAGGRDKRSKNPI